MRDTLSTKNAFTSDTTKVSSPLGYEHHCIQAYPSSKAFSLLSTHNSNLKPNKLPTNTPYESLIPRLSFKTEQTLSYLTKDTTNLIWEKYKERKMTLFHNLQKYFMSLYEGKYQHHGVAIDTHMFPYLHLDETLFTKPHHSYIILRANINLSHFQSLQIFPQENISLQGLIDQALVHTIYGTLEQIIHSDLGKAIKEACKRLSHIKGRYKIMFYSAPPRFTPPVRPATHDIYVTKGCYNFSSRRPYEIPEDELRLFSKETNHDNWRIFNEAKDLDGNIKMDSSYYMIFQNKITRIFLRGEFGTYNATPKIGRLIKPVFGSNKESSLRKEYQEFLSWMEVWQPDEIDGAEWSPIIDHEDDN